MRSGGGIDSNGSAGLSAWGVVDGEAVAVRAVVADVQNLAANLSAAVAKEGMVGTFSVRDLRSQADA